jgi:GDP-D-mannose 3',5'-epimerase
MSNSRVLLTGGTGFIGNHLAKYLVECGHWGREVDIKTPEYGQSPAHEFQLLEMRKEEDCLRATKDVGEGVELVSSKPTRATVAVTTCRPAS